MRFLQAASVFLLFTVFFIAGNTIYYLYISPTPNPPILKNSLFFGFGLAACSGFKIEGIQDWAKKGKGKINDNHHKSFTELGRMAGDVVEFETMFDDFVDSDEFKGIRVIKTTDGEHKVFAITFDDSVKAKA
jgi:hypothetical protein